MRDAVLEEAQLLEPFDFVEPARRQVRDREQRVAREPVHADVPQRRQADSGRLRYGIGERLKYSACRLRPRRP
jgi:hypothetical protein